jgi:hypothetical protein
MISAVRWSAMALRILWIVNIVLGVYLAYFAAASAWLAVHVATGMLIVILLFFLGLPQALVKGGSLGLTLATFIVGVSLALIGMAQIAVANFVLLRTLQVLHVLLVIAAIALAEICARRYFKGLVDQAA